MGSRRTMAQRWQAAKPTDEEVARMCGRDVPAVYSWREQAHEDRTRGRRPAGTGPDLSTPVEGQLGLFETE